MKYLYRIVKKKNLSHFVVERLKDSLLSHIFGAWQSIDCAPTIEECENIVKKYTESDKQPNILVIREFF